MNTFFTHAKIAASTLGKLAIFGIVIPQIAGVPVLPTAVGFIASRFNDPAEVRTHKAQAPAGFSRQDIAYLKAEAVSPAQVDRWVNTVTDKACENLRQGDSPFDAGLNAAKQMPSAFFKWQTGNEEAFQKKLLTRLADQCIDALMNAHAAHS